MQSKFATHDRPRSGFDKIQIGGPSWGLAEFDDHWTKDLDRYFPEGMDTPGIVMIPVSPKAIRYWDGSDESPLAV